MTLLRDEDIVNYIKAPQPLVSEVAERTDWFTKDSPSQPASFDLTIGGIYIPGMDVNTPGGVSNPRSQLTLHTGHTAVVATREQLHLPGDIAGIALPPSRVAFAGILLTNPGHIDPGYKGALRFTVINMAREPYTLMSGQVIASCLFFRLQRNVLKDYVQRRPGYVPSPPAREQVDRLSRDFVDVDERSKAIAKETALKSGAAISALIAAIPIGIAVAGLFRPEWKETMEAKMAALQTEVQFEKESVVIAKHEAKLEDIEADIAEIKRASCVDEPKPAYCSTL